MRKLACILCLVLTGLGLRAENPGRETSCGDFPRLVFGIEWGAAETFWTACETCYNSDDGRVYESGSGYNFATNGEFIVGVGCNLTRRLNLALNCGMSGVAGSDIVIPLTLRTSFFPCGCDADGVFFFGEAGAGFNLDRNPRPDFIGIVGGGHRWALSRRVSIDLSLKARVVLDHPYVKASDGSYLPSSQVLVSDAWHLAAGLFLGLRF